MQAASAGERMAGRQPAAPGATMGTITLDRVSKQFGTQVVLEEVSLQLHTGRVVGLVGRNGAGKTTLFRIIAGLLEPDLGSVAVSRGVTIGYLPQEPQLDPDRTLGEEVGTGLADITSIEERLAQLSEDIAERHDTKGHEELMRRYDRLHAEFVAAGGYNVKKRLGEVLGGLGFSQDELGIRVGLLSGGQRCRAALARLLLQQRHYLLLDEPTNHLDLDTIDWLERFLTSHRGGALVVSHDRYLLDRIAESIIELEDRRIRSFPGNYSSYVRISQTQALAQERQYLRDKAFIDKEQDFIARYHAAQRGREARGRRTRLQRRLEAGEFELERPRTRRTVGIDLGQPDKQSGTVIRGDGLNKAYDGKRLFAGLNVRVDAGERFGITGPNGTGKTTLLRILLGKIKPDDGQVEILRGSTIGYHAQQVEPLTATHNVVEEVLRLRPTWREAEARSLLAQFQFRGDDAFKRVKDLSGGEQSRLRLLRLLLDAPNVLVFDEPTNHLDIPSREALEDALRNFAGTVVVVSHDRYFLDRIVQRLLVIRPETHATYVGNYSDYVRQTQEAATAREKPAADNVSPAEKQKAPPTTTPPQAPAAPSKRLDTSRFDALSIERIEELLIEQEDRVASLQARFGDRDLYRDADALARLRDELAEAQQELAVIEKAWSERAESL